MARKNHNKRFAAGLLAGACLCMLSVWVVSAPRAPGQVGVQNGADEDRDESSSRSESTGRSESTSRGESTSQGGSKSREESVQALSAPQPAVDRRPAIKWHPGHYMQVLRGAGYRKQRARFSQYDEIAYETALEGVVVPFTWSQLESARGDYSAGLELVRTELDKLRNLPVPKRMFIRMMDSGYLKPCPATSMMPEYVSDAGGTFGTGKGCMWRRWDPTIMGYYIDMLKAYAAAFDDDPFLEGIVVLREIPLAWGGTEAPSDYSNARYREQLDRPMTEAVAAFEKSLVVSPTSWVASEDHTTRHIAHVHSISGAVGNMDVCPDCDMWADRAVRGELGGVDFRGSMPLVYSVETSVLGLDAVGPNGGYTPAEIYAWADGVQRVTHLVRDSRLHQTEPPVEHRVPEKCALVHHGLSAGGGTIECGGQIRGGGPSARSGSIAGSGSSAGALNSVCGRRS